ncbi:MAG: GPP34 family phosphoprotein [Nitrospinae bacterium]|nr:GPP34 family phosphoprotein [Nitrospinota bacterium]
MAERMKTRSGAMQEPFDAGPPLLDDLHLHEGMALIALREGAPARSCFALGGAVLAALCLCGRLRIVPGWKGLIEVVDRMPTGEAVLDYCLGEVVRSRRRRRAMHWVVWFGTNHEYDMIAAGLCRRGILRPDDVRSWLFFTRRVYRIVDPEPRRRLLERLDECVFGDAAPPDTETGVLVALADAGELLKVHFPEKRLRDRRRHLGEIAAGHVVSDTVSRAVEKARQAAGSGTAALTSSGYSGG